MSVKLSLAVTRTQSHTVVRRSHLSRNFRHVKQAILDENEPLRPDANGRIEMFLESDAEPPQCNATAAHSKRSSMRFSKSDMRQRPPPPPQTYGRRYAAYEDSSQDESSAFASNVRALSDDDSQ